MKLPFLPVGAAASCLAAAFCHADIPTNIKPVGLGLGGYSYWGSGPFADTFKSGGSWLQFSLGQWGSPVHFYNEDGTPNPQFDANGYPQYLIPGTKLRLLVWPFSVNNNSAPASWPKRGNTGVGKWVLTWQGDADIRLNGAASYVTAESSGAATGSLVNGRRVYIMGASNPSGHITVESINATNPITDIKIWLPDPADPQNRSLENSGSLWHPSLLAYINSLDFNVLRFMDWGDTNASPQQDWADRRRPSFGMQNGILNRRSPAAGIVWYTNSQGNPVYFGGDRSTGMAYEHMVALANATGKDMWVCVPHLVTDDYVTKLAQLIRYGSDGTLPYTSPQANPLYPPLDPSLNVWVEYSNEIWSSGDSFPQGNWAQAQGEALGLSPNPKQKFNARRYAQIWRIFQQQFGGSSRIVRVAGIWTAQSSYTTPFLTELRDYGPTLSPPVSVDVVAPTTYFGNGIQDWAYEQANLFRGSANQWFHTAQDFVHDANSGATRPVSVPLTDPYWSSAALASQQAATFAEWKKRIFSGSSLSGGGPDSTGVGGGFDPSLRTDIFTIFGQHLPIVSYEGGPSLYTDYLDGGDVRDDGVTNFTVALNRRPEFAEIYRIQLNMARSKGLASHSMFVDVSAWGKYGQWGHLEYPDQPLSESVKWTAVADWADEMADIRNISDQVGARPSFVTPGTLATGTYLAPYSQDVIVTGGDIATGSQHNITLIGQLLVPGLTVGPVPGQPTKWRISGTALSGGPSYFYLRVRDDDGDAAWQVYSAYTAGGPGTVLEADLSGSFAGSSSLPWTKTYVLDPAVSWSGLQRGAAFSGGGGSATGSDGTGVNLHASSDGILFSVSQGGITSDVSTLTSAITDNEYWKCTITPQPGQPLNLRNAEMRFSWVREEYHCPRFFAVMSSVGGFTEGTQLYTLPNTPSQGVVTEHVFKLPDTAAYSNLTTPVEFRIYFYGSQYAHKAKILGLKLTRDLAALQPLPPAFVTNPFTKSAARVDAPYSGTLADTASDPNGDPITFSKQSGPAWLSVAANGALSGTPSAADIGTGVFVVRAHDPGGLFSEATMNVAVQPVVVDPVIAPGSGSYSGPVTVAIGTTTSGATIRYTTDGLTPTASYGTEYTGPFAVSATATVKAIASKAGHFSSEVVSSTFTIAPSGVLGTFLQTGTGDIVMEAENFTSQIQNGDSRSWLISTATSGYQGTAYITTLDSGTTSPSWGSGCRAQYPVRFSATGGGTYYIWARVRAPNTSGDSVWVGENGNRLGSSSGYLTVSGTLWSWVRHTTSFSGTSSTTKTIQLERREDGLMVDKIVLTRNSGTAYLSGSAAPPESPRSQPGVAAPVATPLPGTYSDSVQITLTSATADASIRYTTDGSIPTSITGTPYAGPFSLTTTGTVRAIAYKSGQDDSAATSFAYTIVASSNTAFAAPSASVPESAGPVALTVKRNGSAAGAASVTYSTQDGTAAAGQDYTAVSGTLSWDSGDSSDRTITVPILNDAVFYEGEESFTVTLSGLTGISVGSPATATVTIVDDDTNAPPQITRISPSVNPATAVVDQPLSLHFQVADDGFLEPVSVAWSKVSGPGPVSFGQPDQPLTTAIFAVSGTHVIRITAQDGENTTFSELAVAVSLDDQNPPPAQVLYWGGGSANDPVSSVNETGTTFGNLAGAWGGSTRNWNPDPAATTGWVQWPAGGEAIAALKSSSAANGASANISLSADTASAGFLVTFPQEALNQNFHIMGSGTSLNRTIFLAPKAVITVRSPGTHNSLQFQRAGHASSIGAAMLGGEGGFIFRGQNVSGTSSGLAAISILSESPISGIATVEGGSLRVGGANGSAAVGSLPNISRFDVFSNQSTLMITSDASKNVISDGADVVLASGNLSLQSTGNAIQAVETIRSIRLEGSGWINLDPRLNQTATVASTLTLTQPISRGANGRGVIVATNGSSADGGLGTSDGMSIAGHGIAPSQPVIPWAVLQGRFRNVATGTDGGGTASARFMATDASGNLRGANSTAGLTDLTAWAGAGYGAATDLHFEASGSNMLSGVLTTDATVRSLAFGSATPSTAILFLGGHQLRAAAIAAAFHQATSLLLGSNDASRGTVTASGGQQLHLIHSRQNASLASAFTVNAVITDNGAPVSVIFGGPTSNFQINSANTYTGATFINAGNAGTASGNVGGVTLNASGSFALTPEINIAPNSQLFTTAANRTLGDSVPQTLAGGGGAPDPAYANLVASTRTFTLGASGTLSPGNPSANETFRFSFTSGKLHFAPGSVVRLDLASTSDRIAFSGTVAGDWLSGSGNAALVIVPGIGFDYNRSYVVFDNVSTTGFTFASISGHNASAYTAALQKSGDRYLLTFSPNGGSGYDAWAAGIAWNGADPARNADPNRDRHTNFVSYALGLDPVGANPPLAYPQVASSGGVLSLTYHRARAGVTYTVETADEVTGAWTTVGVNQGSGAVGENVTATVPLPAGQKRFLRLVVSE